GSTGGIVLGAGSIRTRSASPDHSTGRWSPRRPADTGSNPPSRSVAAASLGQGPAARHSTCCVDRHFPGSTGYLTHGRHVWHVIVHAGFRAHEWKQSMSTTSHMVRNT